MKNQNETLNKYQNRTHDEKVNAADPSLAIVADQLLQL